jgi:16S rRNA processing protein RimM
MTRTLNDMTEVGFISGTHGLAGELSIKLHGPFDPSWIERVDEWILQPPDGGAPQVAHWTLRPFKAGFLARWSEVKTLDVAQGWVGGRVRVRRDVFQTKNPQDFYLLEVLDFEVRTPDGQRLGTIERFENWPGQDLAIIAPDPKGTNSTHLPDRLAVPFRKRLIRELDFENRRLILEVHGAL